MYDGFSSANPADNSNKEAQAEAAFQWALEDLIVHKKQPRQEDLAIIPQGEATSIIQDLSKALEEGGEIELRRAFKALSETYDWLKALRNKSVPPRPGSEGEKKSKEPVGTLLSEIAPETIRWLWLNRLPIGKLVMIDGDPGLGKTTTMFDIAARLTTGRDMPDQTGATITGGVVLICLEDGLADTIQPRLARAGADLSKIVSIGYFKEKNQESGTEYERPFNLAQDLDLLEAAIERVDAKLVIIDPIMAILGGKDTYKDNEVRAALAPLKSLAERTDACIGMIRHVNKTGSDKLIYQGGGSIAFIGLARVGLMVLKNPDNEEQCILANPKNNLSKLAPKLLYRVVSDENDERPYIKWEGTTAITDQELTGKPKEKQSEGRQLILRCLKEIYPQTMTPQQISDKIGIDVNSVNVTLFRMSTDEQIKKESRGNYSAHSGIS